MPTCCCTWHSATAVSCGTPGAATARRVRPGRCGMVWSSFGLHWTAAGAPQTAAAAAGAGLTYAVMMCPGTLRPHVAASTPAPRPGCATTSAMCLLKWHRMVSSWQERSEEPTETKTCSIL